MKRELLIVMVTLCLIFLVLPVQSEQSTNYADFSPIDDIKVVDIDDIKDIEVSRSYTIGVALPHQLSDFWVACAYGIEKEAEKLGANCFFSNAGGYEHIDVQIRHIQDYVVQRVDGIIVGAVDYEAASAAVEEAWDAGIPVVGIVNNLKHAKTPTVLTDDYQAGERQARYIGDSNPHAKVIMLCGASGILLFNVESEQELKRLKK